jgi:predicted O-methyltransferase YrrM
MRKNLFIIEDKFPLYKAKISDGIKKKCIPFSYISFLFISSLLISNLYYTKKLLNYQENKDMQFSKNKNTLYRNFYENNFEKDKEFDNRYIKENINLKNKFTNFNNTSLETTDLNILQIIENEIKGFVEILPEEQKFFHGLIRSIKPRKIVEIGVSSGGSSVLILNAIKDIKGAKLFSIDRSIICYKDKSKKTGHLVKDKFPELMNKWTLYTGGITSEFIETIGDGIDFAFIDTVHITPGEMLDWLMVLPFLKNESIVVFHDAFFLYHNERVTKEKLHTSNNQLLCYIRGQLILPQYGNSTFFRNIGALKLAPNQNNYYYQYFLALGIQWEFMPTEKEIKLMRNFFLKYYGEKYAEIFDDAVEKNKIY